MATPGSALRDEPHPGSQVRSDGRMVHDMDPVEVKRPDDSKAPWGYDRSTAAIPGEQTFLPLDQSLCPAAG